MGEKQVVSTEENAPAAASPPGFEKGMDWNSDDARKAYEEAGTTLEAEQRKGAPGEPDPITSDSDEGDEPDVVVTPSFDEES
jgi:hypothetical protein